MKAAELKRQLKAEAKSTAGLGRGMMMIISFYLYSLPPVGVSKETNSTKESSTGCTRGVGAIVSKYYYYYLTLGAGHTRGAVAMVMQYNNNNNYYYYLALGAASKPTSENGSSATGQTEVWL